MQGKVYCSQYVICLFPSNFYSKSLNRLLPCFLLHFVRWMTYAYVTAVWTNFGLMYLIHFSTEMVRHKSGVKSLLRRNMMKMQRVKDIFFINLLWPFFITVETFYRHFSKSSGSRFPWTQLKIHFFDEIA